MTPNAMVGTSAVNGNTSHIPRTSLGVQAMKTIFERFVKKAGCIQPHRQCRRMSDNEMVSLVPLVLILVNIARKDVFRAVSTNVEKLTVEKSPRTCSFYRM